MAEDCLLAGLGHLLFESTESVSMINMYATNVYMDTHEETHFFCDSFS